MRRSKNAEAGTCKKKARAKILRAFLLAAAGLFLLVSCGGNNTRAELIPPPTDPLVRDFLGFAVVTASFTHIRMEPGDKAASIGYLRKGSLVKIMERRSVSGANETGTWLLVESESGEKSSGWLDEELVDIYDNESRALTASEALAP